MISLEDSVRKNAAAMKILESLSHGASFGVVVEGGESLLVSRERSGIVFGALPAGCRPDFVITMQEEVASKLFSEGTASLSAGEFLTFSAKLLSGECREKVGLAVYSNFLKLTFHGYLKLLSLGGVAFWKVLKDNGVGSVFAIEKKLATFRNK